MLALSLVVVLLCLLALAGVFYHQAGKRRDRRRYPAPGRIINVDGVNIHVLQLGSGPTVVLEAGIASTSLAWAGLHELLARDATVICYDRAGLGWSGRVQTPRTLEHATDELDKVLKAAGAPAPYLLVGHSYGGLIVRCFAVRHPEKVAGLVLLDPVDTADWVPLTPAQKARLQRGVALSRRGTWLARFGVVRFALNVLASGNSRIPRLISRWSAGRGSSVTDRLAGEVRKLPKRVWPMVQMHWSDEKCFETMAAYLELLPENAAHAEEIGWPSEHIPAIVITVPGVTPKLPPGYLHRVAEHSGHWIQLDQPELVLAAVEELLHRVST